MVGTIPQKLIVGYKKINRSGDFLEAIATALKISRRAKNGLFTIPDKKRFERLTDGNLSKINIENKFRSGFRLEKDYIHRYSQSGSQRIYFLWQDDFKGNLRLTESNFYNLIKGTTVIIGVIQEELICDGKEFVTKEQLGVTEGSQKEIKEIISKKKEILKQNTVRKKDFICGRIYCALNKRGEEEAFLYLGQVILPNNKVAYIIRRGIEFYCKRNAGFFGSRHAHNESYPSILNASISTQSRSDSFLYGELYMSRVTYETQKYRYSLPTCYLPSDTGLQNFRIENIYPKKLDQDLLRYLIMSTSGNQYPSGAIRTETTI